MSVKTDSVRTLLFQVFGLAAGIVTNVVVARTLGPEGKRTSFASMVQSQWARRFIG